MLHTELSSHSRAAQTGMLRRHLHRQARGFTLIEVMAVCIIMTLLASIAYPAYRDQVRKARRADAQAQLLEASNFMERFRGRNGRYDQDRSGTAVSLPSSLTGASRAAQQQYYLISLQSTAQQSFVLRAVPQGATTSDPCGTMTLSNSGVRAAAASNCWRQ